MIIVANRGTRVENLGLVDYRPCSACSSVQPFYLIRQYRYYAVYWLLSFVTSEDYWHACGGCNQGPYLGNKLPNTQKATDASVASPAGPVKPIPMWRRYGLFFPIAFAAGVSVLGALVMLAMPGGKREKVHGIVLENSHSLLVHRAAETPAYVFEPAPVVVLSSREIAK